MKLNHGLLNLNLYWIKTRPLGALLNWPYWIFLEKKTENQLRQFYLCQSYLIFFIILQS